MRQRAWRPEWGGRAAPRARGKCVRSGQSCANRKCEPVSGSGLENRFRWPYIRAMSTSPPRSAKLQAALKRMGNPYASLQVEEEGLPAMSALKRLENPYASLQIAVAEPEVASTTAERTLYIRGLENPYAWLEVAGDEELPAERLRVVPHPQGTPPRVSKEQFRAAARRIFRCYIPAAEKGNLRTHHRDFITRNEVRSSEERALILQQLGRYDLGDIPLIGHFNRERDPFTMSKLSQIEKAALGKPKP